MGLWALADGGWLAVDGRGWSRFWSRFIRRMGKRRARTNALALVELGVGLLFLLGRQRAISTR
jgi:hypothetical protein